MSKWRISVASVIALLLLMVGASAGAQPAAPAVARPEPRISTIGVGQQITIKLYIEDVTNLYGADIQLQYDPAILEAQDADPLAPDVQIQPLAELLKPDFVIKRVACNVALGDLNCPYAGRVWYAATQLNPTQPVSGSGGIAAITFKALKEGVSPLKITYQKFADRQGGEIASTFLNGSVTVGGGAPTQRLLIPFIRR